MGQRMKIKYLTNDGALMRQNGVATGNGVGLEAVLKLGWFLVVLGIALRERNTVTG